MVKETKPRKREDEGEEDEGRGAIIRKVVEW